MCDEDIESSDDEGDSDVIQDCPSGLHLVCKNCFDLVRLRRDNGDGPVCKACK